ncbi:hypothetical protein WT49_06065 [Burkholderia territorii]|nr:hypothetical protein WS99_19740 [Burkholderia territorii]KWE40750.1 hypothetical protein WT49_06065 [Burkholderia territorii]KWE44015.1 hypothetical protein WT50_01410 [Burkholderia territorii]KWE45689.1 hypothetical protein WT51_19115 [Burkholderia territorii]
MQDGAGLAAEVAAGVAAVVTGAAGAAAVAVAASRAAVSAAGRGCAATVQHQSATSVAPSWRTPNQRGKAVAVMEEYLA